MTKDEALKLALEALETNNKAWKHLADSGDAGWWEAEEQPFFEISVKAIIAIKEVLAQPEQEQWPENVQYTGNGTAGREADVQPTAFFFQADKPKHEFVRGECVKCGASIERQEPVAFGIRGGLAHGKGDA